MGTISPYFRLFLFAVIGLVVVLLLAAPVQADTVTVSGTHPTTYTDGTPLPITEIVSTEIVCVSSPTSCPAPVFVPRTDSSPTFSAVIDIGPIPGRGGDAVFYAVTHVAWDFSDPSAQALRHWDPKKPRPPTNLAGQ